MFLLEPLSVFIISVILVVLMIYKIDKYFIDRYNTFRKELKNFESYACGLEQNLNSLEEENLKLQQDSEKIFSLYELTRELTKYLDEQELSKVFCEKANQYLKLTDCRFIEHCALTQDLKDFGVFALRIEKNVIGYLAVEGLKRPDVDNFNILSGQFAMALERAKLYKEIEQLAITDSLTNIYARWYFLQRAEEELHRSLKFDLSFSFLIIDIDHFKDCNDKFGHLVGDVVLRELSKILRSSMRQIDLLGRFGGEEFCILLPETNKSSAHQAAERIRSTVLGSKIKAFDESIKLTVSIGIANFSEDADNLKELIDRSDWALYRAKQTGRNRICLYGVYK